MNELKLLAIKAKNRLLNKGIRDIYSNVGLNTNNSQTKQKTELKPSINLINENERKKQILNMIKNRA